MSYVNLIWRDANGAIVAEARVQAEHVDDDAHRLSWAASREVVAIPESQPAAAAVPTAAPGAN